ncbi:hypothetical protein J2T13_001245 [Paenibacillus sp. DS2015]
MRSFRFWLILISVLVIIVNISGNDDYNILLTLISPLVWIYESFGFARKVNIPLTIVYLTDLGFWYFIGFFLDRWIIKIKSRTS